MNRDHTSLAARARVAGAALCRAEHECLGCARRRRCAMTAQMAWRERWGGAGGRVVWCGSAESC
eukprot:1782381-Pleurochrysis_carterae.AAC.1